MKKRALLIGVSDYQNTNLYHKLSTAPKDVAAMKDVLDNQGAFDEIQILLNPLSFQMKAKIESFLQNNSHNDLSLIYFSGHGDTDSQTNQLYFATIEANKILGTETIIEATAFKAQELVFLMKKYYNNKQIIIIDACHSGAFKALIRGKNCGSKKIKEKQNKMQKRLEIIARAKGIGLLTSSSISEQSFNDEETELSIFTRYIVEGIKSGEASDDNGFITLDTLEQYVTPRVKEAAKKQLNAYMTPQIDSVGAGFRIAIAQVPRQKEIEDSTRENIIIEYPVAPLPEHLIGLDKYLQVKNWREADRETLRVILQIANAKRPNISCLIKPNDIKQFPCNDLRTIDELWLEHSKDRFGFSVQKGIWTSLSHQRRKINKTILQEFGDLLGWRANDNWLEYDDYIFTLEAPEGHLPSLRNPLYETNWLLLWEKCLQGFLSRLETCCENWNDSPA